MEGQENLDNQEELKKEETPENNVQEEIVEIRKRKRKKRIMIRRWKKIL